MSYLPTIQQLFTQRLWDLCIDTPGYNQEYWRRMERSLMTPSNTRQASRVYGEREIESMIDEIKFSIDELRNQADATQRNVAADLLTEYIKLYLR